MKAVIVKDAFKQYGTGNNAQPVLRGLDMQVERGTIYGLLGASGCGKTTLLTCIVGRRRLGSGDIWVLGGRPGSRGSGVPGPRLGYMPQELSLMREFSIRDALQHFGWIYGMTKERFEERYQFLEALLDLPPSGTAVKNLSGGQQRRCSLAVALVHDPELLILDEPTVGLDPVLRKSIWEHLATVASCGTTIIITTHYIEEARQAHKIGLMRNGRLMAEGAPDALMRCYNCSTVEKVFLLLSEKQEHEELKVEPNSQVTARDESLASDRVEFQANVPETHGSMGSGNGTCTLQFKGDSDHNNQTRPPGRKKFQEIYQKVFFRNSGHARALLSKNLYRILRNPGAILFIILFPMLEICAFYLAVGGWPKGMKIGVVNDEVGMGGTCQKLSQTLDAPFGGRPNLTSDGLPYCILSGLSCKFIDMLNDSIAEKVYFNDIESGMKEAKAGKIISLLYFSKNFSESLEARIDMASDASNETVTNSELPVWMDMSLRQSALLIEQKLRETHTDFMKTIFRECKVSEKVGNIPLQISEPVFGRKDIDFSLFMTPGVIITMIFFISVGVTAMIIVVERLDGIWDRTLCAGISSQEILLSHIIIETGVIFLQAAEVFLFVFYIFGIECRGSYFHILILLFLQGFTGMCGGFLVSVSVNSITASNFVSMGSFYPVLILSGLLWPVEGMPPLLRFLALCMPTTYATTALRNIMEKGWGMSHNHVYQGYMVSIIWIIAFTTFSIIVIKLRK